MDQGHTEPDVIKSMTEQNAGFTTDDATKFTQIAESIYCPQHIGGSGNTAATNAAGASGPALLPVASATGCVGRAGRPAQRAPVLCPASLRGPSQRRRASMSMAPAWDDDAREIFRNTLNHN